MVSLDNALRSSVALPRVAGSLSLAPGYKERVWLGSWLSDASHLIRGLCYSDSVQSTVVCYTHTHTHTHRDLLHIFQQVYVMPVL